MGAGTKGAPVIRGPLHLSPSGYDRFQLCEMKWLYNAAAPDTDRDGEAKGEPLRLGTLMHRCIQAWWSTGEWYPEFEKALSEELGWEPGYKLPSEFARAYDFLEEYARWYAKERKHWAVVAVELDFDLPMPGFSRGVRAWGHIDLVLRHKKTGEIRGREIKTMGRWGREARAAWDVQPWLYAWALRSLGYQATGMDFDAIGTSAYKGKPLGYRFRLIPIEWDERRWALILDSYQRAGRRARVIARHPDQATKNQGEGCTFCPFFIRCQQPWELE